MIKVIAFDFDGVLVKSFDVGIEGYRNALKELGIRGRVSKEKLKSLMGMSFEDIMKSLKQKNKLKNFNKNVFKEVRENYWNFLLEKSSIRKTKPVKGIDSFFSNLKEQNIKIAIATGGRKKYIEKISEYFNFLDYIDFIITPYDVENGKPAPDMLRKIMQHFNVKENEMLYVGDAVSDVKMGKNAGIKTIVVLTGALKRKQAERLSPFAIVKDATKIEKFL